VKTARAFLAVGVLAAVLPAADADACMCIRMPSNNVLVTPDRLDDAPLDTHVRLLVADASSMTAKPNPPFGRVVLRVHGGAEVRTRVSTTDLGSATRAELVPVAPLTPRTVYELAMLEPGGTTVFGTFRTGTAKDTTPPKLEDPGTAWGPPPPPPYSSGRVVISSSCDPEGPDLLLRGITASDPGRPDAQLVALVWLPDANGAFDTTKPPNTQRRITSRDVVIGKGNLCDTNALPMPATPPAAVGVVVVDEAGNRSALARVPVVPGPPP
jgi:hypothetical protein